MWSQLQQGNKLRWQIKSTQTHPSIFHFDSSSPDAQSYAKLLPPVKAATTKAPKSKRSDSAVVFYNIYVPPAATPSEQQIIKGIVDEQIGMLPNWVSEVQYNTIGKDKVVPQWLASCDRCKHLKHMRQAQETTTLQNMYDYCQANPDSHVVYMHDKGSLHAPPPQAGWRHLLTRSAFLPECSPAGMPETSNICSARFTTVCHYHTSGNMFSARCSYIRGLVPPIKFEGKMLKFFAEWFKNKEELIEHPCLPTGRFVAEHWAWSHPMVNPSDVYPGVWIWSIGSQHSWNAMYDDTSDDSWVPDLQLAPRFNIERFWEVTFTEDVPGPTANWRSREHSLFRWLLQWQSLYSKKPPRDSWVWSFYFRDHMERFNGFITNGKIARF